MIVVADDLGRSADHNRAILRALEEGLVDTASLMTNMPGYEAARAAVIERRLGVGVHLVLTAGEPLTEPVRRCSRFCTPDGRFLEWRARSGLFRLEAPERDAVARELRAQVERALRAGIEVSHLDSHHHVHNEWPIGSVAISLARDLGVPRVRIARNCGPGIGLASGAYKRAYNARLRRAGLAGTRYFGNARDRLHLRAGGASAAELVDFELMTHPQLDPAGGLVDEEFPDTVLSDLLARVAPPRHAEETF